jgi:hypothetical protein
MLQPFASELSSVFKSARCSASIRPLTVKITSPFVALVILSILPLFDMSLFRVGGSHNSVMGNHNSNCEVFYLDCLAAEKCRNFVNCLNSLQQSQEGLFSADG